MFYGDRELKTAEEIEAAIKRTINDITKASLSVTKAKRELEDKEKYLNELKRRLNKLQGNCYYVYIVFVNGEPKYVGKGTGDRYKHAVSGASSVPELNRDFFKDCHIEVMILYGDRTMSEEKALQEEKNVIGSLHGIFEIYNKLIPEDGEWSYMDCDFRDYSKTVICNKDYKYPRYKNQIEKELYEGFVGND